MVKMVRNKVISSVSKWWQVESTCYSQAKQAADIPDCTGQDSPAESVIKKQTNHPTFSSLISKTAPKTSLTHARASTYLKVVTL